MLTRLTPDRFEVDFARVPRERSWKDLLGRGSPVIVDGYAVARAVTAALAECPFRNAAGAPQVWNEYRVLLSRADHDRLLPLEATLQGELGPMLYQEILKRKAATVGAVVVRLLVAEDEEVAPGHAILHARHVPDAQMEAAVPGELTVRLDKLKAPAPTPTARLGNLVLSTPGGEVPLDDGVRYVLGRAAPDAGPDHLALPGAPAKVNRRQCSLRVDGAEVEVGREPGGANPVAVNGTPLPPGGGTRVALPAEISLSGGAWVMQVRAC